MGVAQFIVSVRRILRNPHVDHRRAIARHLGWQWRRVSRGFPTELPLSESVLVARTGRCGVSALVNAHGMYDYNNMLLIKRTLADGGLFVDVGANIGAFSLIASEQPRARVLAFEPHPATFERLRQNLARNARQNVEAVCAALGDHEGSLALSDTPGSATTHAVAAGSDGPAISVPLRRLDRELAKRGIAPDVLKIDVEGFEYEVLSGCGAALGAAALVLVEINGLSELRSGGGDRIVRLLRNAGAEGPYYYDARRQIVSRECVHVGEDPIFINRERARAFPALASLSGP